MMKVEKTESGYAIERPLEALDEFVIDFVDVLEEAGIDYVIVSGYVSILFGRSRSSEDVDIIIKRMSAKEFARAWDVLTNGFECIITNDASSAYADYLMDKLAIRFARNGEVVPNIEIKFPATAIDAWTLKNGITAKINGRRLNISPIELQIAFKLYLGSDKDIEDAKHLYLLLKDYINHEVLEERVRNFRQEKTFRRFLK